ncbi:9144_t:CDS:2, partial [Diversispora eburnea]
AEVAEEMNRPTNSLTKVTHDQLPSQALDPQITRRRNSCGLATLDTFSEYFNRVYALYNETGNHNNRHGSQEALNGKVENKIPHENPNR